MTDEKLDTGTRLHLEEADTLKKQWVKYVYKTIDDLSSKLDSLEKKVYDEREYFLDSLMNLKETLRDVIDEGDAKNTRELKGVVSKLDEFITETRNKFSKVNFNITEEVKTLGDTVVDERLTLKGITTKIGVYSAITTIIFMGIITILATIFKDAIKAWFGG